MHTSKIVVFPNEALLSRAIKSVAEGKKAIIPVKGQSMFPFIIGNRDCVELFPPDNLQIGDIVLAKVNSQKFILHRILRFHGEEGVTLMGDGNLHNTEECLRREILAKALLKISPNGKTKRLDSFSMKFFSKIWKFCLPMRGLLLRIFRKIMF